MTFNTTMNTTRTWEPLAKLCIWGQQFKKKIEQNMVQPVLGKRVCVEPNKTQEYSFPEIFLL